MMEETRTEDGEGYSSSMVYRPEVEKESGGGERIGPKARWHVCMKEQSADTLIEGAENTFGTAVLLECVWTS